MNRPLPGVTFPSRHSAFHVIACAGRPRSESAAPTGSRATVDTEAARPDPALVERALAKVRPYLAQHRTAVECMFPGLGRTAWRCDGLARADALASGEVLADALAAVAAARAAEARDHLVALYLCRVMTYWDEIERMGSPAEIDAALDAQTAAVIRGVARRTLELTVAPPMSLSPGAWAGDPL